MTRLLSKQKLPILTQTQDYDNQRHFLNDTNILYITHVMYANTWKSQLKKHSSLLAAKCGLLSVHQSRNCCVVIIEFSFVATISRQNGKASMKLTEQSGSICFQCAL